MPDLGWIVVPPVAGGILLCAVLDVRERQRRRVVLMKTEVSTLARRRSRQAQVALASGAVLWTTGLGFVLWLLFGHFGPKLPALVAPVVIALGGWMGVVARVRFPQAIAIGLMVVYIVAALFSVGMLYA